jgi:DNA helicase-2/ATP-dependent DNA helicase PcrA
MIFVFYTIGSNAMFKFSKKTIHVNEEQKKAIMRPKDTHQRIIASAGSGKTTTITARIAYLIEHYKIESNRIVLLTFSKNSANQMKKKLYDLIGDNHVYAGTFHGLSKALLQKYSPQSIQTLYFIDELVSMGEQWLKTYDGRKWVGKIKYIFVDEFQDINNSQWNMILRMLWPGARLTVVGDDCQNIYTWRGSNVNFILNLDKHLKTLVDDQLHINYRSSDNIIQVANSIMKHIPTLPWKHTMISALPKNKKPEVHFFYRACDETSWIIKQIQKHLEENPNTTIAIMSRINVDLYRFEEECIQKNISYRLFDLTHIDENEKMQKNSIDLVTIHSSKGLEWDIVYLVHMNDDIFPSSKKKEDIINERRLFYVAVTRAEHQLYISYTNDERNLSRFIREIPNTLLTYTGLAKYMLSEFELGKSRKRLVDILGCLTTDDLTRLRSEKYLGSKKFISYRYVLETTELDYK